jgi:hypothetical protein
MERGGVLESTFYSQTQAQARLLSLLSTTILGVPVSQTQAQAMLLSLLSTTILGVPVRNICCVKRHKCL